MSRFLMAASLSFGMLCSGAALAQSSMSAPSTNSATKPNSTSQPGMAATSSGIGGAGTGASSAAIGTGNTEKGDFSPQTPGLGSTTGVTGANPNDPGGVKPSN